MTQLTWWSQQILQAPTPPDWEWILVEVTATPSPQLEKLLTQHRVHYLHLPCTGVFHKTQALNLGLARAQGNFVAAFDVDLIPVGKTLERHCWLAERSPHLLLTGYRLMALTETLDGSDARAIATCLAQSTLGPEDQPTALRKHLLQGERFGVMPLFERDRLLALGGWDETFLGWGAEDQDLIERYLQAGLALSRCPELVYLHLHHGPAPDWNIADLTAQNRAYYYAKQRQQDGIKKTYY